MENLEHLEQPNQEKVEGKKKIIREIQELQNLELQNAQVLKNKNEQIPSHIQEFLVVDPAQLSEVDLAAFEKFQEFLGKKGEISSLDELKNRITYFKDYKLKCDCVSQDKLTLARDMARQGKTAEEIQAKLDEMQDSSTVPEKSKFFMGYIANRVNGLGDLITAELMDKKTV